MQAYFDFGSGYPVDKRVIEEMVPYMTKHFGNASSIHAYGLEARKALETARKRVAALIGAKNHEEVLFTSGATESNNFALRGIALRNKSEGKNIVISNIEHLSVLNVCKYLEKNGFTITKIPVDNQGLLKIDELEKALKPETILVSIQTANPEIGTIQDIYEIGKICEQKDVYFHTDAVAAAGKIPIDVEKAKIDLLTLSSNDIYGPRGTGAIYIRTGTKIEPLIFGGGQEKGLRSGTEDIASIVGFGKAAELAIQEMDSYREHAKFLQNRLIDGLLSKVKYSYLNGSREKRIPTNVNIRFNYIEGEAIILNLDMHGIYVSTGSACVSKTLEESHVLMALGVPREEMHGSLQFTIGKETTKEETDYAIEVIPKVINRLRAMSPLTPMDVYAEIQASESGN